MSDHRPLYYVTEAEAARIRELAVPGSTVRDDSPRLWAPPDGPIELVEATGRADCRDCGHRIAKGARAIRFGFLSNPPGGSVVAAYIHDHCPEEDA